MTGWRVVAAGWIHPGPPDPDEVTEIVVAIACIWLALAIVFWGAVRR